MDNINMVILEGRVLYTPELTENNGKKALNFLIENVRSNKERETHFKYNCVAWGALAERIEHRVKEGVFLRITGHLQDNVVELADGKIFHYSKTCVDYIEFD